MWSIILLRGNFWEGTFPCIPLIAYIMPRALFLRGRFIEVVVIATLNPRVSVCSFFLFPPYPLLLSAFIECTTERPWLLTSEARAFLHSRATRNANTICIRWIVISIGLWILRIRAYHGSWYSRTALSFRVCGSHLVLLSLLARAIARWSIVPSNKWIRFHGFMENERKREWQETENERGNERERENAIGSQDQEGQKKREADLWASALWGVFAA